MTLDELILACKHIRATLEAIKDTDIDVYGYASLKWKDYPRGSCTTTSQLVILYLYNKLHISPAELSLMSKEKGNPKPHDWVKYNNLHIDLTGDQYGKEKILISNNLPWPDCAPRKVPFNPSGPKKDLLDLFERLFN